MKKGRLEWSKPLDLRRFDGGAAVGAGTGAAAPVGSASLGAPGRMERSENGNFGPQGQRWSSRRSEAGPKSAPKASVTGSAQGASVTAQDSGGDIQAGGTQAKGPADAGQGERKRGGPEKVLYGKQPDRTAEDAQAPEEDQSREEKTRSPAERRRAWRELVEGEYKDLYTEETQRAIDRRFRETASLRERLEGVRPILETLMERYGIEDGDLSRLSRAVEEDGTHLEEEAEKAGMSVEQYRELKKLKRENAKLLEEQRRRVGQERAQAQLRAWGEEAEKLKGDYPGFDLRAEADNPQFLSMLRSGVPVRTAYEVVHMEEIKKAVARATAQETEKLLTDGIRAKGARPAENGTAAGSAFTVKDEVGRLTRKDRAEIARRALMGERITF